MQRERCIRECRKLVEEVGAPGSAPKNRQNLFGTRYDVGLFVLALRLEQRTQAVNGRKRVRVLRAEPLAKALDDLTEQRLGLVELAARLEQRAQVINRRERVLVVGLSQASRTRYTA